MGVCTCEDYVDKQRLCPCCEKESAEYQARPINPGVHAEHCCQDHGCKYGDENCPVEKGVVAQEYPCENCFSRDDFLGYLAYQMGNSPPYVRWWCMDQKLKEEYREVARRQYKKWADKECKAMLGKEQ